jgi:hypothetical protein
MFLQLRLILNFLEQLQDILWFLKRTIWALCQRADPKTVDLYSAPICYDWWKPQIKRQKFALWNSKVQRNITRILWFHYTMPTSFQWFPQVPRLQLQDEGCWDQISLSIVTQMLRVLKQSSPVARRNSWGWKSRHCTWLSWYLKSCISFPAVRSHSCHTWHDAISI